MLLDAKKRRYLITLAEGGEFHSHAGFVTHADVAGQPEGVVVRSTQRRRVHGAAADARGLRDRDAAWRAGDLPEGPRADLHAGRHRPRHAGVRDRHRVGRAVDDDAAVGGRRSSATRSARTSPTGPRPTSASSSVKRCSTDTTSTSPTATRESTPHTARSTASCSTYPSRGRSFPTSSRSCAPAACSWRTRRRSCRRPSTREQLKGRWIDARTIEVLHRGWHIDGQAVRPDHRMVAHTAFLTVARFLGRATGRCVPTPRSNASVDRRLGLSAPTRNDPGCWPRAVRELIGRSDGGDEVRAR